MWDNVYIQYGTKAILLLRASFLQSSTNIQDALSEVKMSDIRVIRVRNEDSFDICVRKINPEAGKTPDMSWFHQDFSCTFSGKNENSSLLEICRCTMNANLNIDLQLQKKCLVTHSINHSREIGLVSIETWFKCACMVSFKDYVFLSYRINPTSLCAKAHLTIVEWLDVPWSWSHKPFCRLPFLTAQWKMPFVNVRSHGWRLWEWPDGIRAIKKGCRSGDVKAVKNWRDV